MRDEYVILSITSSYSLAHQHILRRPIHRSRMFCCTTLQRLYHSVTLYTKLRILQLVTPQDLIEMTFILTSKCSKQIIRQLNKWMKVFFSIKFFANSEYRILLLQRLYCFSVLKIKKINKPFILYLLHLNNGIVYSFSIPDNSKIRIYLIIKR